MEVNETKIKFKNVEDDKVGQGHSYSLKKLCSVYTTFYEFPPGSYRFIRPTGYGKFLHENILSKLDRAYLE